MIYLPKNAADLIKDELNKHAASLHEKGKVVGLWTLAKYANDADYAARSPYSMTEFYNSLVNVGMAAMWNLVTAQGGTAFSNANASIGVGDSSTATTASMTDLQAATNKTRVAMNATYPNAPVNGLEQWQSSFGSGVGNYAWNEFAVFNTTSSSGGTMLNRAVSTQGTKTAGQTWQITLSITLS